MLDYFFHTPKKNIKLSMVILVKNEEDIIEKNIKFHSKMGIDSFVIMDNNSDDNTRDILKELQKEYELTIISEKGDYKQSKFMTKLAKIAKQKYKPDWIINNDADEFWIPTNNKTLKQNLSFKGGVLWVQRSNMILYETLKKWENSRYRVVNQILQREGDINLFLTKIGRKTIINPYGYFKTNSGNHSAEHIAFWNKKEIDNIHIYHYPIRSFEQFKKNIENRVKLLKRGAKMGNHYKRWATIYEKGELEKEFYNNLIISENNLKCLDEMNIIKKDDLMYKHFKNL